MDDKAVRSLVSTVQLISTNLDVRPESWREQLQAIRNTTKSLEILDRTPEEARKAWQLPLVSVFQRVAFADADNEAVHDVANWCLRQTLTLLQLYPEDTEVLALIGRNWLMRAQKSLASVHRAERGSSRSNTASASAMWHDHGGMSARAITKTEQRLYKADYVEARGILFPAVEYLQRAVDTSRSQGNVTGILLATAAEAHMSMGNVTSYKANDRYFQKAIAYLREAADLAGHTLPTHLKQYLDEYGSLYPA